MIHDRTKFIDVGANPGIFAQFNPCAVLRADDRVNPNLQTNYLSGGLHAGMTRRVKYIDEENSIYREYELMLVKHAGADLNDIHSTSATAIGDRAGKCEGRIYTYDNLMDNAARHLAECYGVMLGAYYSCGAERGLDGEPAELQDIEANDYFWVIRKGKVELKATDAITTIGYGVIHDTEYGCTESATPAVIDTLGYWLETGDADTQVYAMVDFTNGYFPG